MATCRTIPSLQSGSPARLAWRDFRGVEQHLDYLQQLGVTTLWTTPVYDNDGGTQAYHGYSATDLYRTDPHFGSMADLRHLSDALHRRDEAGPRYGAQSRRRHASVGGRSADGRLVPRNARRPSCRQRQISVGPRPHATPEQRRDVTEGWFANVLPDLNQENPSSGNT